MLEAVRFSKLSQMNVGNVKKVDKADILPHAKNMNGLQKDTFQKQNKLNSICALSDGFGTPLMV